MAMWPLRRLAALGAVLFVVLNVVGFALPGKMPGFGASGATITSFVHDHHRSLVIAVLLLWFAVIVLVGVIAQISHLVREAGHGDGATAIAIAGAAAAGTLTVAISLFGTLTQMGINGTDAGIVKAMYEMGQFTITGLNWITLALVIALTRAAMNGVFPRWCIGLNGLIGIALVLGGICVRGSGAFASGTGMFALIGFIATMVLFVEIAGLLWRAAPAPARAPVPAHAGI